MNYRLVSRHIGALLFLLVLTMGACVGLGFVLPVDDTHNRELALGGWAISIAITAAAAIGMIFSGRASRGKDILRREAVVIVGLGWLICSAFAALPYLLCAPGLPLAEAYFEAVSGLTTTGATVFTGLESLPATVLLWRSLTQWVGGIGILAMFVLILSGLGASGRSLFQGESSAHMRELVGSRMRETVRSLWILYSTLTLVCAAGLWTMGMSLFQAINHAMTTLSTGGFGTETNSIEGFGDHIRVWLIGFMIIGSISFPLYLVLLRRRRDWRILKAHEETWWFFAIIVVIATAIIVIRSTSGDFEEGFIHDSIDTVFNAVSVMTTTGYGVGDYSEWPVLAEGLVVFLMLVGGCAGSTSGGLKVGRLILWLKLVRIEIRRAYRPNQTVRLQLNGRAVPEGTRGQLFVILTSAAVAIAVSAFILEALEPDKSLDGCGSAVISSVANIGPAFKEFGPTANFSSLSPPSMVLLSLLMILGRLEYIAVLVLFSRTLWRKF